MKTQFPIGTKYMSRGKYPREYTVTDILTTRNHAGTVVRVRYVATHDFCGQSVTDQDVCWTTIKRGINEG